MMFAGSMMVLMLSLQAHISCFDRSVESLEDHRSLLCRSIVQREHEKLRRLIKSSEIVNALDNHFKPVELGVGWPGFLGLPPALCLGAYLHDITALKILRECAPVLSKAQTSRDYNLVWCALSNGHSDAYEMCDYLLQDKILVGSLNALTAQGTALYKAAEMQSEKVCALLLDKGAWLIHFILRNEELYTPLHVAAERGSLGVCRLFLERGAGVHGAGLGNGYSPLAAAARGGNLEVFGLLLELGARPDQAGFP